MEKRRKLLFFNNYYQEFYQEQPEKVKGKIDFVLYLITVAEKIPQKFFTKLTGYDELFEIRIEFERNIYRIFCCFDEGNVIVLFNAFHKKTQKTPKMEIVRALKIKQEYFDFKKGKRQNERNKDI